MVYSPYERQIWDALSAVIQNDYGVAGLMGNLYAESSLIPGRVQGDFSSGYSYSIQYTAELNGGQISRYDFAWNGPNGGGYGLAQWTYYTRKYDYYDFFTAGQHGRAGTVEFECWYLIWELQNRSEFANVYNTLRNATSVRQASDIVLTQFENPAEEYQTEYWKQVRASYGQALYDEYHGSQPEPPTPTGDGTLVSILYMAAKKKRGNFIFEKRWYKK